MEEEEERAPAIVLVEDMVVEGVMVTAEEVVFSSLKYPTESLSL